MWSIWYWLAIWHKSLIKNKFIVQFVLFLEFVSIQEFVFLLKFYYINIRKLLPKPGLTPVSGFGPSKLDFKTGFEDLPVLHALVAAE